MARHFGHLSMSSFSFTSRPVPSSCRLFHPSCSYLVVLSRAVQDRADKTGGITLRHRFCAAAELQMALRVIQDLAAKLASRERVPLHDEHYQGKPSFF